MEDLRKLLEEMLHQNRETKKKATGRDTHLNKEANNKRLGTQETEDSRREGKGIPKTVVKRNPRMASIQPA